jgi:hypothetical protein
MDGSYEEPYYMLRHFCQGDNRLPLPGFQTFQWVTADQNQVFFPPRRDASMSQTKRPFFLSPGTPPASILLLAKHSANI